MPIMPPRPQSLDARATPTPHARIAPHHAVETAQQRAASRPRPTTNSVDGAGGTRLHAARSRARQAEMQMQMQMQMQSAAGLFHRHLDRSRGQAWQAGRRASTSDPQRGAVEMRLWHFCTMTAGFIMLMEDSLGRERRRHATCCCHRARAGGAKPRVRVVRVVPLAGASLAGTPRHQ